MAINVVTVLLSLTIATLWGPARMRTVCHDDDIKDMVAKLWSPDGRERGRALDQLLQAGQRAEPYLIELLEDLVQHVRKPHFATGKEREGEKAWKDPIGHHDLLEFEITWRLISDCVFLLSDMKCSKSIPLMIRLMALREDLSGKVKFGPEMHALVNIGEPAVPTLLAVLRDADSIAISVNMNPSPEARPMFRVPADVIRTRAVNVLGEIGDQRALPALEDLLLPGAFERGKAAVERAIKNIHRKESSPR